MNFDSASQGVRQILENDLFLEPAKFTFAELDSLTVINLIMLLEEKFGLTLDVSDIGEEHFGSYDRLVKYVAARAA